MTSQADKNPLTIWQIKHNTKFDSGAPGGSVVKNPPANAGDVGSIPELGRSPGKGNGNPFQYSHLGNPMDRGALWATVHEVTKESDRTERPNNNNHTYIYSRVYLQNYIDIYRSQNWRQLKCPSIGN